MTTSIVVIMVLLAVLVLPLFSKRHDVPMWMPAPRDNDTDPMQLFPDGCDSFTPGGGGFGGAGSSGDLSGDGGGDDGGSSD